MIIVPDFRVRTFNGALRPKYHSDKAVGFDIASTELAYIGGRSVQLIRTGLIVSPPDGFWVMLTGRSSLQKKRLMLANGVGVVDPDYCGPEDEIKLALYNFGDDTVTIMPGDRLAQGILMPHYRADIVDMTDWTNGDVSRGGFGSTGQ